VIVENKLTPLHPSEAAAALAAAYQQLTGALPSEAVLGLLIAQSALETGDWTKIHNFNFGNQKADVNYPRIVQFRCSEIVDGVEKFFDPPAPECNFRAYESAADGGLDYLRVLHSRPHWWQGLHTGDPSAFVDALATPPKYFTANPALYKSVLIERLQQFGPLALGELTRQGHPPTSPLQSPMALPRLGPVADSDSPLAWVFLPSGSFSPLSGDHGDDASGVRMSVPRGNGAATSAMSARAIEPASPSGSFSRWLQFIARLLARAFGRSSA
jgi:hypothetical protein